MLKLYHGVTSVCSIKVRLGLAEIGLPYEGVVLDLQKGDQHDTKYLRLNPDGVVPTLVDDGLVLVESSLILEYLDRTYNAGQLMPDTRRGEVEARHWLLRCLSIHDAVNTLTFSTVMRSRILASRTPEQIEESLARMPNPAMRVKRMGLLDQGLESPHVDQALLTFSRTFADMTSILDGQDWMGGKDVGIVDIALAAYIDRLHRLGFEGLWAEAHEPITHWLAGLRVRPSYIAEVSEKIPESDAESMRSQGLSFWPDLRAKLADP